MTIEADSDRAASPPALTIRALRQQYVRTGAVSDFAVEVESLEISAGDFVVIQGPNGAGKTTLLHVMALLRKPTNLDSLEMFQLSMPASERPSGQMDIRALWTGWRNRRRLEKIRSRWTGFVPQQLELLPSLRVSETIAAPLWLNGVSRQQRCERVQELLERFGLAQAHVAGHRIARVSGGQQQKTALARAIAHRPGFVFLDEPTAYLFHADAREALQALQQLQTESSASGWPVTVVMVTHDRRLADDFATRLVELDVRNHDRRRTGYVSRISARN